MKVDTVEDKPKRSIRKWIIRTLLGLTAFIVIAVGARVFLLSDVYDIEDIVADVRPSTVAFGPQGEVNVTFMAIPPKWVE
ncbi:hypothetical protein [Halocynthiibacter styelae]|uniref:Uncharacterized protein n=1 Tax=Halocynthiibacter styelae TaxID=2761955 RepID=A0A8J7LKR5_9RHOB|nr:hypothetical protein [Paenihalocynthiibacter styelae]MBI1494510.1 hypothetical protein [Paenihalocynthiibacter styelae]